MAFIKQTNKQKKQKKSTTKTHTAKKTEIVESNAACPLTCHFPLDTKETRKKEITPTQQKKTEEEQKKEEEKKQ